MLLYTGNNFVSLIKAFSKHERSFRRGVLEMAMKMTEKMCLMFFSKCGGNYELCPQCYFRDSQVQNIHLVMFTFNTKIKNPASTYKCFTWGSFILVIPLLEVKFERKSDHLRSRTYSRHIRGTTFFPPKFFLSKILISGLVGFHSPSPNAMLNAFKCISSVDVTFKHLLTVK